MSTVITEELVFNIETSMKQEDMMMYEFKYIKDSNKARCKIGKREEGTKILADFFTEYKSKIIKV
jgi:predicted nucleotidyltransferase